MDSAFMHNVENLFKKTSSDCKGAGGAGRSLPAKQQKSHFVYGYCNYAQCGKLIQKIQKSSSDRKGGGVAGRDLLTKQAKSHFAYGHCNYVQCGKLIQKTSSDRKGGGVAGRDLPTRQKIVENKSKKHRPTAMRETATMQASKNHATRRTCHCICNNCPPSKWKPPLRKPLRIARPV